MKFKTYRPNCPSTNQFNCIIIIHCNFSVRYMIKSYWPLCPITLNIITAYINVYVSIACKHEFPDRSQHVGV